MLWAFPTHSTPQGEEDQDKTKAPEQNRELAAPTKEQVVPLQSPSRLSSRERETSTASSSQVTSETLRGSDFGASVEANEGTQNVEDGSPVDIEELNRQIQAARDAEDAENSEKSKLPGPF